ncbi:MAG TPA: molybdate ABC transporter substrate-binding protein [Armatimonadetes bacterium]|nr:molybdate ABC transporter substrate-binding protein [Armatimonadota bacterium]
MKRIGWLLSLGLVGILGGCSRPGGGSSSPLPQGTTPPRQVEVFVPCGMIIPFNKVKRLFREQTGLEVDIFFENAVNLLKRIRKGARPDVLVTPGELEMKQMEEEGYLAPASVRTFGTYQLVLIVPGRNKAGITALSDLTKPSVKQIAIADPEQNSVGYYAREALKNLGLWEGVQDKLVTHWHALQAAKYVVSSLVDAGLYYASCPFDSAPEKLGNRPGPYRVIEEVPPEAYPKVKVQAGLLREAPHPAAGWQFLEFLLSPQAQHTLAQWGLPNYSKEENP